MKTANLIYTAIGGFLSFLVLILVIYFSYAALNFEKTCYYRRYWVDMLIPIFLVPISAYLLFIGISGRKFSLTWCLSLSIPALIIIIGALLYNGLNPLRISNIDCLKKSAPQSYASNGYIKLDENTRLSEFKVSPISKEQ